MNPASEAAHSRGKILIVEDDPRGAELLAAAVELEAYGPIIMNSASTALAACRREAPVAVLVDWTLPDRPGVEVCREIRALDSLIPILFVSARTDKVTIGRALDSGADDFIQKPFDRGELIARLEAHIRKALEASRVMKRAGTADRGRTSGLLRAGDVEVDLAAREVRVAGRALRLGSLEFALMENLIASPGVAVSRSQLMTRVYGDAVAPPSQRVDMLVRRVRAKLGPGPGRGDQIVVIRGYGYRWQGVAPGEAG